MSALSAPPKSVTGVASAVREALRTVVGEIWRSIWPDEDYSWLILEELTFFGRGSRHSGAIVAIACFGVAMGFEGFAPAVARWTWAGLASITIAAVYLTGLYTSRRPIATLAEIRAGAVRQCVLVATFSVAWCSMGAALWSAGVPLNHMMLALLLAASLAGSISTSASHPASAAIIIFAHAVFMIVPSALSHLPFDHIMAGMETAFVALLSAQAVVQYNAAKRLLTLEHERSGLVEGLRLAKQESDRERARAVAAGRAKSQFLSNMNHELRTPMNAILGFSELIKQKAFGTAIDRYAEYADIIHQSGQNLLRLIDDMLDLAKIEGGKLSLRESEVSLAGIMSDTFAEHEAIAESARLSFARKIEPGLPHVLADERALRQIVKNLVSNALKYTPPGGAVTMFTRLAEDGSLIFGVEDTGIGIAEEDQPHVFERFGRGRHDVTSADKGTGIGLAIVKGFAEAHDGEVKLESALGAGTRITVYLPKERLRPPASRKAG